MTPRPSRRERSEACNSVQVGRPTRTGDAVSDDLVLLDISPSTFAEHLAAAQSKLFDSLLDV